MFKQDMMKLSKISPSDVNAYRIFRSPTNHTKFNIVAVDSKENTLFVRYADLTFEEAEVAIDTINSVDSSKETNV